MTTDLVYPMLDSYDSIQNVLLIDQSALQSQVFYDSANAATYPILYNSLTKREDLSQLLSRFTHLDRIAFVFHGIYPGCYYDKPFLEEPFFTLDASGSVIVSENVSFVQSLITTFTVSHVDFLGCNLLLSEEWIKYFDVLSASCVIGASNDQTGNLKYGGDWILENTTENVRATYFTSQIENYSDLLVTTAITSNVTLTQSGTNLTNGTTTYDWTNNGPIPISSAVTVKFGGSINITTATQTFNISASNVTIDGSNNTVTVNNFASFPGLFTINPSLNNITLQNIKLVGSSARPTNGMLVGATAAAAYPNEFNVLNCSITGTASFVVNTGFFFGPQSSTYGNTTVLNCFNTIQIGTTINATEYQAGFFPPQTTVRTNSIFNMTNCYNSGNIGPSNGQAGLIATGLIINANAVVTLRNCFNTGNIINGGYNAGLICPDIRTLSNTSILNLTNCYNTGSYSTTSPNCYGLTSGFVNISTAGNINLTNCYNTGTMSNGAALILLSIPNPVNCYVNIINSYSTAVAPLVSGGLTRVTLTNTFSTAGGSWTDSSANAALTNTPTSVFIPGTVWASPATNTPYLLSSYTGNTYVQSTSSFTGNLYVPNTASVVVRSYTTGAAAYGTSFTLLSVNSANPATYATIASGVISFSNLLTGTYLARVLSYTLTNSQYSNYVFSTFTIVATIPTYPANTYNHTFYTYSSATPTVLTRTIYNAAGVLQTSTDISFGGQNILTALTALDSSPYTIGLVDTSNNKVSMDLAFFGAYNATLTTTQQNAMMTYVNTYKEPRTAATTYAVTVSGGVFNINGVAQPNLTFVSGNLYVFDQSSPTNIGNTLVLGTTPNVSSSIVGNNVVYNGTPGYPNAYTLIDLSGTNPATTSLYYFSSSTTGMGSTPPPFATNIYVNSTTSTSVTSILIKPWTTVNGSEPYKFSKTAGSGSYSGTYYVSSSSICDNNPGTFGPVQMFDISYSAAPIEFGWLSGRYKYNDSNGQYIGSNSTTYNTSSTITGEWAQIQIPYALKLKSFTFLPTSNWVNSLPVTFYILGSNNGTTWTNLYNVTNYVYSTYITTNTQFTDSSYLTTFTVTPVNKAYSYFRLVINGAFNSNSGFVGLKQWNLYGDAYTTAF